MLYDNHGFSANELEKITYYLCHAYARIRHPISIPVPVQYAHLAASRARNHITALETECERRPNESAAERVERENNFARYLNQKIQVNDEFRCRLYYC